MTRSLALTLVATVAIALATACGGGSDGSPTATATLRPGDATAVPAPTSSSGQPTPPPIGSTASPATPGPTAIACPVDPAVCVFSLSLLPLLKVGDTASLFTLAEPVAATCPSAGFGGPSIDLCAGAAAGEQRYGYWDFQAGEGLLVTEEELRETLDRWFAAIRRAGGSDDYGPGDLHVGSIFCPREAALPSGNCEPSQIRVFFTFINAPDIDPSLGTGLPGERSTFFVSTHRTPDGTLKLDGFGTIVPPNDALNAMTIEGTMADGKAAVFEFYPWPR